MNQRTVPDVIFKGVTFAALARNSFVVRRQSWKWSKEGARKSEN